MTATASSSHLPPDTGLPPPGMADRRRVLGPTPPEGAPERRRMLQGQSGQSLARLLRLLPLILGTGLALVIAVGFTVQHRLGVGGSTYERIIVGQEFISDIVPPTLSVRPALLIATQALEGQIAPREAADQLDALRGAYDEHMAFWIGSDLPEVIRTDLARLGDPTDRFWAEAETVFLPAITAGNRETARASIDRMLDHFSAQDQVRSTLATDARAVLAEAEAEAAREGRWLTGLSAAVALALFGLLARLTRAAGRLVITPIEALTETARVLSSQNYDVVIPFTDRTNEVGQLARSLSLLRDSARHAVRLQAEAQLSTERAEQDERRAAAAFDQVLSRFVAGDLTARMEADLPPAYAAIGRDLDAGLSHVREALAGVKEGTTGMRVMSGEIASAAEDLSRRTESQAASLEETAAAVEEITATVKASAESAAHARTVVGNAKVDAERSGEIVRHAVEAMNAIEGSSRQIGQIIGVIDEIAFQTNLLALNAGVEAARAGEAGRGFAVVATEVRALAQRSAEAARQIKDLISASTSQVDQGVELVGETGRALGRIVTAVAEINDLVAGIAAGAAEQSAGITQVNVAIAQMDRITQQNAAMVEESTAAARELADQTGQVAARIERFRTGAEGAEAEAAAPRGPARPPRPVNSADAAPAARTAQTARASRPVRVVGGPDLDDGWSEF